MARIMKGHHWVPRHRWKLGRDGYHPGYWAPNRPKSKKVRIEKKPTRLYLRRDPETGYILGYSKK